MSTIRKQAQVKGTANIRQMIFVEKVLKQTQVGTGMGEPSETRTVGAPIRQIVGTQLKLDPISLTHYHATMSSKNSDLDSTLLPLEIIGAGSAHMRPFDPAPMANSAVAVTAIVEEDASTVHKQSQEFRLDSQVRLELDKSFRNMRQPTMAARVEKNFENDIIESITSITSAQPQFLLEAERMHKQKEIEYRSNMEQLGAMTISKYPRKSNMKTYVAGAGLGMHAMEIGQQPKYGDSDTQRLMKRDMDGAEVEKFLQALREKHHVGAVGHKLKQLRSMGSPRQIKIENPIKITGVKNGLMSQKLQQVDEQQAFLNHLLVPYAGKKATELMSQSPIRITHVNSIATAAYGYKDDQEEQLHQLISHTLNSATPKKAAATKRASQAVRNLYTTHASNYTLNEDSNTKKGEDAEAKWEAVKAAWQVSATMDQRATWVGEESYVSGQVSKPAQQNLQWQTQQGNQDFLRSMRFPKIKTVYVPVGQGPPKTPRDLTNVRNRVMAQPPPRLHVLSSKSGYQRWKTPAATNHGSHTADHSTAIMSTNMTSRTKPFDLPSKSRANQRIMQVPKAYRRSPETRSNANAWQASREGEHRHQRVPPLNFNFGIQANKTQNFSDINTFRDSLSLPSRTIHIQNHPLPASAVAKSHVDNAMQKAFDGVARLANLNESSQKAAAQIEDMSITTGGYQVGEVQQRGISASLGAAGGGLVSPVSFTGSYSKPDHEDAEGQRKHFGGKAPSTNAKENLPYRKKVQNADLMFIQTNTVAPPSRTTGAAQAPTLHQISHRATDGVRASVPADMIHSNNFYLHIEKQPQLSIDYELQIQQQIRLLQKQIRLRNEQVKKQIRENGQQLVIMEEGLEMKQRLQRVAQQIEHDEGGNSKNELGQSRRESKHESPEHTQSTAQCHQTSLAEGLNVDKRDECEQVDFGSKSGSKPLVNASWWPLEENPKVATDYQERDQVKQSFDLKIVKKQMLPHSVIAAMPSVPPKLRRPFKNGQPQSPHKEGEDKKQDNLKNLQNSQQKNLQIEHQISNLYKKQLRSDLSRDKRVAEESIQVLKNQTQVVQEDAEDLREENQKLKNIIKKYKSFIANFDGGQRGQDHVGGRVIQAEEKPLAPPQEVAAALGSSPKQRGAGVENASAKQLGNVRIGNAAGATHQTKLSVTASQSSHYSTKSVDTGKLAKLIYYIKAACRKSDRPLDLVLSLLENVKTYLHCQKAMFIPVDHFLGQIIVAHSKKKTQENQVYDVLHEIDYIDQNDQQARKLLAISQNKEELGEIIFSTISDSGAATIAIQGGKAAILFRQCKRNGPPSFIIQAEFDTERQTQPEAPSKASSSHIQSERQKFKRSELLALQAVFQGVQLTFENVMLSQKTRLMNNEQQNSIALVSHIAKCTTLRGLMRETNAHLMNFFGFDDINVLFHDPEKDQLYTITFGDEEEQKARHTSRLRAATSDKERDDIEDEAGLEDVLLNGTQMIFYPTHTGMTSKAFHQQQTFVINNFAGKNNAEFVSAIDNPRGLKHIKNYMVGSLQREDKSSNGVISFFNNKNPILPYDQRRFAAVARFFGGCIQNIESKTTKLTTMLAIGASGPAEAALDEAHACIVEDGAFLAYQAMQKAVVAAQQELKKQAGGDDDDYHC